MGKKAEKRKQLREEQLEFVQKRKEARKQAKLDKHDGYNVTNKVFNSKKYLENLYEKKQEYENKISGFPQRFVKNICLGLGLNVDPSESETEKVLQILTRNNLLNEKTNVFSDFIENSKNVENLNLRIVNGCYLILLNSFYNVTKESLMNFVRKEKIGKHDFERWISTAVNKIFKGYETILDEILHVFKTDAEIQEMKERYKNHTALNKSPITILAYCQKHNMDVVKIRTRFGLYYINVKDIFKGGPFESIGERNMPTIDDDGTLFIDGNKIKEGDYYEEDY